MAGICKCPELQHLEEEPSGEPNLALLALAFMMKKNTVQKLLTSKRCTLDISFRMLQLSTSQAILVTASHLELLCAFSLQ